MVTGSGRSNHFSGEYALLFACARIVMDERASREARRLLESGLDWERLVEIGYEHRLVSLLHENIKGLGCTAVPDSFLARLKELSVVATSWNVRYTYELSKVLEAIAKRNTPVMLLKGMALIQTVYRNMSLRPMNDIDILVHEQDFRGIRSSLHDLGYDPPDALPDLDGGEAVEYCHYFDQIKFYNKDRIMLDTHFRLLNMGVPGPEESGLWERAREVALESGAIALVPSPEDMLLHLCFHANHHRYSRIMHFCDIRETYRLHADTLDWEYLERIVTRRRLVASFYHTLLFTSRLMDIDIPGGQLGRFRPNRIRRRMFEGFWKNGIGGERKRFDFGNMQGPIFYLLEMDGLADKARFLLKSLFPPRAWLVNRFQGRSSILLYFRYHSSLLRQFFNSFRSSPAPAADSEERR